MQRTHRAVWVVGGVLTCVAYYLGDGVLALSAFVGAVLAGLNLLVLARTVRNLLDGLSASWGAVAAAKFMLLLGATYLALSSDYIDALGFTLGLAALPFGIVLSSVFLTPSRNSNPRAMGASSAEIDNA